MEQIIFNSSQECFDKVSGFDTSGCQNLQDFFASIRNINNGCRCSRDSRVGHANQLYRNLGSCLTDTERQFLKTSFNTNNIIAKEGDNIVWQIS